MSPCGGVLVGDAKRRRTRWISPYNDILVDISANGWWLVMRREGERADVAVQRHVGNTIK